MIEHQLRRLEALPLPTLSLAPLGVTGGVGLTTGTLVSDADSVLLQGAMTIQP